MTLWVGVRSKLKLRGVHPDLRAVMAHAIANSTNGEFVVVCGLRSLARQRELYASGASKTMNSRHLTGHAVDLAPIIGGKLTWSSPAFHPLASSIKFSAHELEVAMEWGGDFNNHGTTGSRWVDLPHYQLPRGIYHDDDMSSHSFKAAAYLRGL